MLRIGIVAGEASGDTLGAGLIGELQRYAPDLAVEGIGGDKLKAAGMRILYPMDRLSVMGIVEVFGRYRELSKIRTTLRNHFITHKPDVFIGIDAPDFNLWLEKELKRQGIRTVHYVSPSVWAWREYRIHKIRRAVDLMLNLFPFETEIYHRHKIKNCYVGHPLADTLPENPDKQRAAGQLGLPGDKTIIALLPGSRSNEIKAISEPLLKAAEKIQRTHKDIRFISGLTSDSALSQFEAIHRKTTPEVAVKTFVNRTHLVIEAADIVMLASGTATLETMLLQKPMVVAYRLSWLTYFIVKWLVHIPFAALPNILAGERVVPECLQSECVPDKLASEALRLLGSPDDTMKIKERFSQLSGQLRKNANRQAAEAVLQLVKQEQYG